MFDIGWTEMLVVGVVMILVVGPKELPGMLRSMGKAIGSLRRMASDFQGQFNDALREAELHDLKEEAEKLTDPLTDPMKFTPLEDARKSMEEFQSQIEGEQTAINEAVKASDGAETSSGATAQKSAESGAAETTVAAAAATSKAPAKKTTTARKTTAKKPAAQKSPARKTTSTAKAATGTTAKTSSPKAAPAKKTPGKTARKTSPAKTTAKAAPKSDATVSDKA